MLIHETIRKYLLLLKEMSPISSDITSNTTRVKTGIKQHAKVEYCGACRREDKHITDPAQRYVYPLFFLLLLKEISSISIRTTSNTTRFTGIKQLKRWIIMVLVRGDTHITGPAQRYAYTLSIFWLFELSLTEWNFVSHTYLTRLVTWIIITLDKERSENEC